MAKKKSNDPLLEELITIKKLLVLALYGMNFPSEEINKAARIGSAQIRGMFSKKNIAKARKVKDE